jgi:hypothetical protein
VPVRSGLIQIYREVRDTERADEQQQAMRIARCSVSWKGARVSVLMRKADVVKYNIGFNRIAHEL